jgi:hypothetical protein
MSFVTDQHHVYADPDPCWLKVFHAGFFDRHLGLRRKFSDFFSQKKYIFKKKIFFQL